MGYTTKWKHIEKGICEKKKYEVKEEGWCRSGQKKYNIECPFCHEIITIPIWALTFKGKRCSCGALIINDDHAYRIATTQDTNTRTIINTKNPIPTMTIAHQE